MLLAGGQGSRLGSLTRNIAKPAVSFGGKYRIIDFSLSNCTNSNIDTVGVLTQYKPFLLNSYIGSGAAWDLDNAYGGVHILPPYMGEYEGSWYKGTANAIYQNIDFVNHYDPDYVLIISGDHIYKMDYSSMLKFHKDNNAEVTISTIEVAWEEASRFGILTVDSSQQIVKFEEKPSNPVSNLASMGIYIFDWPILKDALIEDAKKETEHDFGKNIIPQLLGQGARLYGYPFRGYWKDVGTIDSYYLANMEILEPKSSVNIFDHKYKIYSNDSVLTPQYIGGNAKVENSLVSNGCIILGEVSHSILAPGVYVGEGAKVKDSIVLHHAKVQDNALVQKAIVGENAEIAYRCIVGSPEGDGQNTQKKITVIEDHFMTSQGTVFR